MRSRSSRLFIVLVHLVGVSTNLPRRLTNGVGIVGVHPMAILLERLSLEDFDDGLDGLLRAAQDDDTEDLLLAEPFWLQDDSDGKCFGPTGFSECGDATLWLLRRAPLARQRRGLWNRLLLRTNRSQDEQGGGYALQLVDMAGLQEEELRGKKGECLVRHKREWSQLGLGSCTSRDKRAWTWRINSKGILSHEPVQPKLTAKAQHMSACVSRTNITGALLAPCHRRSQDHMDERQDRRVKFSLVRYQISKTARPKSTRTPHPRQPKAADESSEDEAPALQKPAETDSAREHMPMTVDLAHSHASGPLLHHTNLKPVPQLLFGALLGAVGRREAPQRPMGVAPLSLLKGASPILLAGKTGARDGSDTRKHATAAPTHAAIRPHKIKIPTHPYIEAAKDEVWTDPQTGLEYLTDFCGYLGHDRRESGRHTLVGVGQYLRTVFNIKVYGIAMYVSKRDVLADPSFEKYADLTTEELRADPNFFTHLREMPSSTEVNGGMFDRTLLLKLNMQLSTETMRSSLNADWKLLTDESKEIIMDSSLRPRPADERMLQTILSEDNPGRCSCGQIAPEEYNADISCCARGTELVFTWRKNGDLEARLDGQLMDVWPRPDIAEGIFYEYLRTDDPISPDFLDRVVDGFPFLLAPLAQVKGVSMVHPSAPQPGEKTERGFLKSLGGVMDMASSQTESLAKWVHNGAVDMASQARSAAEALADSSRRAAEEMERRRMVLWSQVSSIPETSMNFVSSRLHPNRRAVTAVPEKEDGFRFHDARLKFATEFPRSKMAPRGRVFRFPAMQWFGEEEIFPDEIEPIIQPTTDLTRTMFFTMVHFYLLLLLIVSFPGSQTRTRLSVRRSKDHGSDGDTDSDSTMAGSPRRKDPYDDEKNSFPSLIGETKQSKRLLTIARRRQALQSEEVPDLTANCGEAQAMKKSKSFSV